VHAPEALRSISPAGRRRFVETVDFGRRIGATICVETGPRDKISWRQRPNRPGLTRFVENRKPEPSTMLTVVLEATDDPTTFVCLTAFIGGPSEPEPWDPNATGASRTFWATHALVLCDDEPVVEGTETTVCPW
jgi:hypothetical protein